MNTDISHQKGAESKEGWQELGQRKTPEEQGLWKKDAVQESGKDPGGLQGCRNKCFDSAVSECVTSPGRRLRTDGPERDR